MKSIQQANAFPWPRPLQTPIQLIEAALAINTKYSCCFGLSNQIALQIIFMESKHSTSQCFSMAMATSFADSSSSSTTIPSLDFTSLTFTLPNSTPLNIVKLDGPNYLDWVSQFLHILQCNDLLGIVDGSEPCPPKTLTNAETQEQ